MSPPPPNINVCFSARFLDQANNIQNLINYIDILITPFFYIALYFIRRSIYVLAGIVFLVLYIEYVDAAYIARGAAISNLLIIFLAIWYERPKLRTSMVIGSLLRSEEHTSELQSLMRISYAVFCLKKK